MAPDPRNGAVSESPRRSVRTASCLRRTGPAHFVGGLLNAVEPWIARHVIAKRSAHQFRRSSAPLVSAGIRRTCGLSRRAGFARRRNLCRQKRHSEPSPAYFVQPADLALGIGGHLPIRQPAILQRLRRGEDAVVRGELHALRLGTAKPSTGSTVSRATRASLIFRLATAARSAARRAIAAVQGRSRPPFCEHQRDRAGESVPVGLDLAAGGHLLRDSISDTLCVERMDDFQTRVGFCGEKESKCLQKKMQLGGVRF